MMARSFFRRINGVHVSLLVLLDILLNIIRLSKIRALNCTFHKLIVLATFLALLMKLTARGQNMKTRPNFSVKERPGPYFCVDKAFSAFIKTCAACSRMICSFRRQLDSVINMQWHNNSIDGDKRNNYTE